MYRDGQSEAAQDDRGVGQARALVQVKHHVDPGARAAFARSRASFGAGSNWSGAGVYGTFTPAARTASGPPCAAILACWLAFARASVASESQIARSCASHSSNTDAKLGSAARSWISCR